MAECKLCDKNGPDLSLLLARHKELGNIYVCRDCWTNIYEKNETVTGGTGSCGPCSTSTCGSCSR